jgi:integrase
VTGLRISEALNLRVSDVDWTEGILTIRHSKFGKSRLIPLHASSIKILSEYGPAGIGCSLIGSRRTSFVPVLMDGLMRGKFVAPSTESPGRLAFERLRPAADRACMTFVTVLQWRRYCAGIETGTTFSGGYRSYPLI